MRLFRVAREAPAGVNLAKTGVQVVVVWGLALGALPAVVVAVERRFGWRRTPHRAAGIAVFAAGSATGLWSAAVMATRGRGTPVPFDAARELVVAGPYRVVRNPMAISAVVQLLGVAVAVGSPGSVALAAGAAALWNEAIRPPEEAFLADRFGPAYERYRSQVACWRPRWPPFEP